MATIQGSSLITESRHWDATWLGFVASGDVGTTVKVPAHVRELAIQAVGSFGTSLAVQLLGSNDGVNFAQLSDLSNTAISLTTTAIIRLSNPPAYLKPLATAGTGGSAGIYIHGSVV